MQGPHVLPRTIVLLSMPMWLNTWIGLRNPSATKMECSRVALTQAMCFRPHVQWFNVGADDYIKKFT